MGTRILPAATDDLRSAIRQASGVEVFAIGSVEDGCVTEVVITCRGQQDRVTALLDRPKAGQVVIHNHPSGNLTASDADMELAGFYGQNGVGVVIVDSDVSHANWVVEPHAVVRHDLDENDVQRVFEQHISKAIDGFEVREEQLQMALAVTRSLNDGRPLVVEAGTGTGKSLAYLVPAAMWALKNDAKVVISTFTRTLQAQLMDSDVPTLERAGSEARVELLQGRNNYLCRRRLEVAKIDAGEDEGLQAVLDTLSEWSDVTTDGSRLDVPVDVDADVWRRVRSDVDLTLRARCPHFASCHYYAATRRASGAHVVIVNHALLLADLSLRAEIGRGVLPQYDRVILDEGHHLEDAATGVSSEKVSREAVAQALRPLVDRGRRRGALGRLARDHLTTGSALRMDDQVRLEELLPHVDEQTHDTMSATDDALASLAAVLPEGRQPLRITPAFEEHEEWTTWIEPTLRNLANQLERQADLLEKVIDLFGDATIPPAKMEPLVQIRRSRGRLVSLADRARSFLVSDDEHARWVELARRRRGADTASIVRAPIDVAKTLRRILWNPIGGVIATSATLTVGGKFTHFARRTGLFNAAELVLPSPFDHSRQALLGLPRDLAEPNQAAYLEDTARAVVQATRDSGGGAFVLCTSYEAVRYYADALRRAGIHPVLVQGEGERTTMLHRFRQNRSSVLVGTDSFWEGVSVKGDALRLVILPRIPFRVPSDPLYAARVDALVKKGLDAFRVYALPEAVLKLRQGYGRLIRSRSDRGVVLLLDTRVHTKSYGRIIQAALPPARRVRGPIAWVLQEAKRFASEQG